MVEYQLRGRGITDPKVLSAFLNVPRELFVPLEYQDLAYADGPLPIGFGQTISQPYMVALMTEALKLESADRVLEIGTGSGYQAAILAKLVSRVYSVERIESLTRGAENVWRELRIKNYELRVGDGSQGWAQKSPFDKIIITAASAQVPPALFDQLKIGGYLLAPIGPSEVQELIRYRKKEGGGIKEENLGACRFVPLITVSP